jgi:hypothetical protein
VQGSNIIGRLRGMSRFFFHLETDGWLRDEQGKELPSAAHAQLEALRIARSIAGEDVTQGSLDLTHAIVVHDDAKQTVAHVSFAEAVKVTP